MAIVINGSGTVTGLAVGGLPDGTVDDGTVASGIASSKLTGALPAISGASLTSIPAANITGTLPAIDGSALTGSIGIGNGQSWTNVTGSRSTGTVYTNSTGKPIMVSVSLDIVAGAATVNWFYVGSVKVAQIQNTSTEIASSTSFVVPNGSTYKHQYQSVAPTIRNWSELS